MKEKLTPYSRCEMKYLFHKLNCTIKATNGLYAGMTLQFKLIAVFAIITIPASISNALTQVKIRLYTN